MPKLSKRLETIASLVPSGARVCDIGTDHGYLSIELVKRGDIKSIIAVDVNEKPLLKAKDNIGRLGAVGIELRLSNGFEAIKPNEADTAVIAGIGGEVIAGIIKNGEELIKKDNITLILQPTTSPEALRQFLFDNGYKIEIEIPLSENDKLYSLMVCKFYSEKAEYLPYKSYIGEILPDSESGYLYIQKQYKRCLSCAKALESIPEREEDYKFYKSVADDLENILKR